jgi:hypothetical protein
MQHTRHFALHQPLLVAGHSAIVTVIKRFPPINQSVSLDSYRETLNYRHNELAKGVGARHATHGLGRGALPGTDAVAVAAGGVSQRQLRVHAR